MKIQYYYVCMMAFLLFASCEKELKPYDNPECRLNFMYYDPGWLSLLTMEDLQDRTDDSYSTTSYSFIYAGNVERDTLWFGVQTSGFLSDQPRPITLKQITVPDTVPNAKPGIHYIAFDSPEISSSYVVPANTEMVEIPVVLLRDTSLNTSDVVLRFGFEENDYFKPGFKLMSYCTVYISAHISCPTQWKPYDFGEWAPKKHELMIEWTGNAWDDAYIEKLYNGDSNYITYLSEWFQHKLEEENAKRLADPNIGDIYREADGTPVDFTPKEWV